MPIARARLTGTHTGFTNVEKRRKTDLEGKCTDVCRKFVSELASHHAAKAKGVHFTWGTEHTLCFVQCLKTTGATSRAIKAD